MKLKPQEWCNRIESLAAPKFEQAGQFMASSLELTIHVSSAIEAMLVSFPLL